MLLLNRRNERPRGAVGFSVVPAWVVASCVAGLGVVFGGCASSGASSTTGEAASRSVASGAADASAAMAAVATDPVAESAFLSEHVQLTFADDFVKAGEAYFNPSGTWIIFQAVPVPPAGVEADPHYSMYVAKLQREGDRIAGIDAPILVSAPESANTCGWFHPDDNGRILFGSTVVPPADPTSPGYSRDTSRYSWEFPREMEICTRTVQAIVDDRVTDAAARRELMARPDLNRAIPMFARDGYDAEGSWSPDGRSVLYCEVDPETGDGDLWIYHVESGRRLPLITEPGYDGGPFFSPDGRWICYRSDREQNNLLQIYISQLAFDVDGLPVGIAGEYQLTDAGHVNWAPYFSRPGGEMLAYASSELSHRNYEVYSVPVAPQLGTDAPTYRVTFADGFDGLPVFSFDGRWMMWTAQRGDDRGENGRPSSQLWMARTSGALK